VPYSSYLAVPFVLYFFADVNLWPFYNCHRNRGELRTRSFVYTPVFFWYNCRMGNLSLPKLQRTAFTVGSLFEQSDEKSYWLSKSPYERLEAVELMRQIIYGYDPSAIRLQRVLEVTQRSSEINKKASGRHQDLADLENLP